MSQDANNWNKPFKRPRKGAPAGLKGKEIGLFYRNQQLQKKRDRKLGIPRKRDFELTFNMPPAVVAAVMKNVRALIQIAKEENITLPQLKLNYSDNTKSSGTCIKSEPEIKSENTEDITPESSNYSEDLLENVIKEADISIVKSEPVDDSIVKSESFDAAIVKSEAFDVSVDKSEPVNVSIIKSESADETEKQKASTESAAKSQHDFGEPGTSKDDDNKKLLTKHEPKRSTTTAMQLINSLKQLNPDINQRLLDLRQKSAYKYGYEDIITGTFEEKLNENLSRGISINVKDAAISKLNLNFYTEYEEMIRRPQYKEMLKFREKLPTYKKSKEILEAISNNQVVVISGETGCGKSTQLPQIILDDGICSQRGANVKILVTQPRRIAASSLALRVAKERGEKLGNSVGYSVRLEKVQERTRGSILYCTTGILLTELEVSQGLGNYSHIVLDEVHERDSHIDLAMCALKEVLKKRKDLKIILMSATIDAESLSAYFGDCQIMHIEGLAYPVQDVYLEDILQMTKFTLPENDRNRYERLLRNKVYNRKKAIDKRVSRDEQKQYEYLQEIGEWLESKKQDLDYPIYRTLKNQKIEETNLDLTVELIKHISGLAPGAILVFVPGFSDISSLIRIMENSRCFPPSRFDIYPLHSKLPTMQQHKIFEKPPSHIRKIIIATNIAETSITIDDIVYVVDCGRLKMTGLHVEQNIETLEVKFVSKANMHQRRGRAGRCQPGICYHMVTSFRAAQLVDRHLPELQRSNLLEPVLMIKKLRLGLAKDALKNVPSPPAESAIQWAVTHLQRCGALNSEETLTPLGWHLARLPLHPSAGKLILFGALFGCLDRAASIAAVWGFKDPFLMIIGKEREIDMRKRELTLGEPSDHIAVSEAIIRFERSSRQGKHQFCYEYFLSYNTLEMLSDMKKQLGGNLKQMGFLTSGDVKAPWENRNGNNFSLFKAIVAAALYPNIANVKWVGLNSWKNNVRIQVRTPEDGKIKLHPSSVMSNLENYKRNANGGACHKPGANWLVYWMKRRSTALFLFDVTLMYTLPLLFFGELNTTKDEIEPDLCIFSISNMRVRTSHETANLLLDLRALLDHVLAAKVMSSSNHQIRTSQFEEQILNTVIELITAEDEQADNVGEELSESDDSDNECESDAPFSQI